MIAFISEKKLHKNFMLLLLLMCETIQQKSKWTNFIMYC